MRDDWVSFNGLLIEKPLLSNAGSLCVIQRSSLKHLLMFYQHYYFLSLTFSNLDIIQPTIGYKCTFIYNQEKNSLSKSTWNNESRPIGRAAHDDDRNEKPLRRNNSNDEKHLEPEHKQETDYYTRMYSGSTTDTGFEGKFLSFICFVLFVKSKQAVSAYRL